MSRDGALARARALRDELVKRGVPVSIEIQQGRPGTPNGGWLDTRFIGSMGHHIVSRRSQGLTPGLALIKRGRTDVPGPLCNGYLGFDGVARIICMGWANHPGAGGPYTLPGGTIPKDAARPYLFGWEIEGGITELDWPASFRIVMGKCHAATLAWLRRDERSHIEHKTWAPTRKIDRLNYTLTKARAELKPFLTVSTPNEEDDMPSPKDWTEADWKAVNEKVGWSRVNPTNGKMYGTMVRETYEYGGAPQKNEVSGGTMRPRTHWIKSHLYSYTAQKVSGQVAAAVAAHGQEGVDPAKLVADIEAAVAAGVATSLAESSDEFIAVVLDRLGEAEVSRESVAAAIRDVLREGVGSDES